MLVVLLCWMIVVFDGYDLIVYGTTISSLTAEDWGRTVSGAGLIASLAFTGMAVGALGSGVISDRLGRRNTVLVCLTWFTVFTALCAFAPSAFLFGAFRFLAGLGLGGLVPSANALTAEFVTPRFRSVLATAMMSGVPLGGVAAALLAKPTIEGPGWQTLYLYASGGLLLAVVLFFLLPESPSWLRTKGRDTEAARIDAGFGLEVKETDHQDGTGSTLARAFSGSFRMPTILFTTATFSALFAWYGLGSWMVELAKKGHLESLGDPGNFLLALSLGAVAGSILTAYFGTKLGPLRVGSVAAAFAAAGLLFMLTEPGSVGPVYVALILAGIGSHGTACLIMSGITIHYPTGLRATGLGIAFGLGRVGAILAPILAGFLLESTGGAGSTYVLFGAISAACAVCLAIAHVAIKPPPAPAVPA